jgi:uncharacterized protein with GYD domain
MNQRKVGTQYDARIGLYGEYDVVLCAETNRPIQGRHSTTVRIRGGYHFRVLNQCNLDIEAIENIRQKLLKFLPKEETQPKPKKGITHD